MKNSSLSFRKKNNKRKIFLKLFVFLTLLALLASIVLGDVLFMKRIYSSEVKHQLEKTEYINEVFTENDIVNLPEPIQRYFRYCGYIGKNKMSNAKIVFEDVDFLKGKNKLKLDSEQFNFVEEPSRIVYLSSKIMGFIPFEGRDKFQDGRGFMTGKLMKVIPIFDETGPEMNQSALVTYLAESLVVPNSALQDFIKWGEIDSNNAKGTMKYNGIEVSGIFTFNDKGEFIKFVTDDRYMDKGKGVMEKERWTAEVSNYIEKDGLRLPNRMKGIWNLADGDIVYFDGIISNIQFNVKDF